MADEYSDVELNLWVDAMPSDDRWRSWLDDAGATDVQRELDEEDFAGFRWTVCRVGGIWIEIGWAEIEQFDGFVRDLAGSVFADHDRLKMGWTVERAVSLRTLGRIAAWQRTLKPYPAGLSERVVAQQTAVWSDPHVPPVRWALAARGERMGLALRLVWDMQNLLRVLFAVNQVWDRDLKWTDERSLDLSLKPDALSARIDAVFTLTDLGQAVEINQRLIVDTLELATQQGFEVGAALRSVQDALHAGLRAAGHT